MAKNRNLTESQLANLKRDAGPGRPLGSKNFKTVMREAMIKIAEANKMTPEELEIQLQQVGLRHALKGNFQFYKDITDRSYGKTPDVSHINLTVEPNERVKKLAKKLNGG
jgi:hypothetical protein